LRLANQAAVKVKGQNVLYPVIRQVPFNDNGRQCKYVCITTNQPITYTSTSPTIVSTAPTKRSTHAHYSYPRLKGNQKLETKKIMEKLKKNYGK